MYFAEEKEFCNIKYRRQGRYQIHVRYVDPKGNQWDQPILEEISPGCSLAGLMLKVKLQYFGPLIRRADSFEKTLMLGKIEGGRRRGRHRMRWLDGFSDSMDMGLGTHTYTYIYVYIFKDVMLFCEKLRWKFLPFSSNHAKYAAEAETKQGE